MRPTAETRVALDALFDPVFVARADGAVEFANEAGHSRFGAVARLTDIVRSGCGRALERLVARALGSTKPLVGGVELPAIGRTRVVASLLVPRSSDGAPLVMVRFGLKDVGRFRLLGVKFDALDAEVRQRRRAEARLLDALGERELLVRKLHHRVKNNVQMTIAMIAVVRRDASHREVRSVLAGAERRLAAVSGAQQMLYRGEGLTGMPARDFLAAVAQVVLEAHASACEPEIDDDGTARPRSPSRPRPERADRKRSRSCR